MATRKRVTPNERNATYHKKPIMKQPSSKKTIDWAIKCIDYYTGLNYTFGANSTSAVDHRKRIKEYYDIYNNNIPDRYFQYITNPYKTKKTEYTNFGAKIRDYSIIRTNIEFLLGKYRERPLSYSVNVNNPDAVSKLEMLEFDMIMRELEAMFMEEVDPQGRPITPPEEVSNMIRSTYRDERAIQGQAALDYIVDVMGISKEFVKQFKDFLIAGYAFSYKGVRRGDVEYRRVNPLACSWDTSVEFAEDGEFFCEYMGEEGMGLPLPTVIDMFYDELTDKDIEWLEQTYGTSISSSGVHAKSFFHEDIVRGNVEVVHTVWKAFRKVGKLTYTDMFGETLVTEVDESYELQEGDEIEWYWVNEVWGGYRIGNEIYVNVEPIETQRRMMNNISVCKLPYNGRAYSNTNSENISVVKIGIPFQLLYIGCMFQMEKLLNKNKGKIALIDKNTIPKKEGWDEEKFFYYADALGYMIIDRNQAGVDKSFNQYNVLDMSTVAQIQEYIGIMEYLKREWDASIGFTPQTKGQGISASTRVGAVQEGVSQASVINEELFGRFDEYLQKEFTGLLDVSKWAWRDGKKSVYASNDMRNKILDTDPINYASSDFSVFVSNNSRNQLVLEQMRQMSQAFAQNGQSPATILEIMNAQNPSKLRDLLEDANARLQKQMQEQALQEQEAQKQMLAMQQNMDHLKNIVEMERLGYEYDRKERIEAMKLTAKLNEPGEDKSTLSAEALAKLTVEREKIQNKALTDMNKIQAQLVAEQMKSDTALKVAKQNKNKYDK